MADNVRDGDVGTIFRVALTNDVTGAPLPINHATTLQMKFQKPTGEIIERTATLTTDGSDGKLEYITVSGDIDMTGGWTFQGYAEGVDYANSGEVHEFTVGKKLNA